MTEGAPKSGVTVAAGAACVPVGEAVGPATGAVTAVRTGCVVVTTLPTV